MSNNRKPEEIASELIQLRWKVRELENELCISNAIYGTTLYDEYKNKWVLHNAYESGSDYIHVLGMSTTEDAVYFYGYGVHYDEQSKTFSILILVIQGFSYTISQQFNCYGRRASN